MVNEQHFMLSWRKLWIVVIVGFVSIILHNGISFLFNIEEPVFFSIVLIVLPFYLIVAGLHTLYVKHIKK